MAARRIGLIVNPIAGMGGAVGLKGTDGPDLLARAYALGAVPRASERAAAALRRLAPLRERCELLASPSSMGAWAAEAAGFVPRLLVPPHVEAIGAEQTRAAATALATAGVELILFAGGDGTARDLLAAIGDDVPVLGIPSGVKMRSGVFAPNAPRAGEIAAAWLAAAPGAMPLAEAEIVDLDDADGSAQRLYGVLRVPAPAGFRPAAKASPRLCDAAALDGLARELAASMASERTYLFGPGTTTTRILRAIGMERPSLLGVDAVRGRRLVGQDLCEADILSLLDEGPASVVVGIVGGQGFLFGRGNQPLGARVLARVGRDAIIIVAGLEKLTALEPPRLLIDTGDAELDRLLSGWIRVAVAPGRTALMRIEA